MPAPIPAWTATGVLPPLDTSNPTSPVRAPYPVSLHDLVVRFGTSPARRMILDGYLRHRAALHALGYRAGFQWLDGSFMEDVETLEGRPPRDMDVVTFMHEPVTVELLPDDEDALDHGRAKERFHVDSYLVELDALPPRQLAQWSAYWYSLWAHRRSMAWKGFLQVELAPDEDALARAWLDQNAATGAQP